MIVPDLASWRLTVKINFTQDKHDFMKQWLKIFLQRNFDFSLAYRSQHFACIRNSLDQTRFFDSLRKIIHPSLWSSDLASLFDRLFASNLFWCDFQYVYSFSSILIGFGNHGTLLVTKFSAPSVGTVTSWKLRVFKSSAI